MPAASPLPQPARAPARRTLRNSPNRRREAIRITVWLLFTGGAAAVVPYLVL